MIALIITTLNKSPSYAELAELFVNLILKGYRRVDIIADCYKTKSIKSSKQWLRGQSGKIHAVLLLSTVPGDCHKSFFKYFYIFTFIFTFVLFTLIPNNFSENHFERHYLLLQVYLCAF